MQSPMFCFSKKHTFSRGGYRVGAKGAMAPPSCQGCPTDLRKVPQVGHILRRKCPRWGTFCSETAPGGAHLTDFAVKVPRVGQIPQRKCPNWGRLRGESAPDGADFAEKVPHARMSYVLFVPTFFSAPPPKNSCIRPCIFSMTIQVSKLWHSRTPGLLATYSHIHIQIILTIINLF